MAKKTKAKTSKFKNKTTANAHKQKSQGAQYGHLSLPKGVNVFKEEPGSRTRLDFLPYEVSDSKHPDRDDEMEVAVPGELWYKRPYKLHRNVGVNNDSAVCPTSIGKKCPVCEYRAKLLQEGADWQDETVKTLKPSDRNLYVVVPKGLKDYEEKPHIWDISQFLFQNKLNDELEEDEEFGVFPDLEEGLTVRIRFSEEQIGKNKFADTSRIDFEERDEQYDEDILKKAPNLDEVLSIPTHNQLEAKFFELEEEEEGEPVKEEEEEEEEEEKPKRKSKSKKAPEPEPEEEEEPEEDEDNEEECKACEGSGKNSKGKTCRPCKGTGIKGGTSQEEEEPEEEEKPKKSSRKKSEPAKSKKKGGKKKENKCPFDHTFGEDCEEYDDCDDCDEWDACMDAKEETEG